MPNQHREDRNKDSRGNSVMAGALALTAGLAAAFGGVKAMKHFSKGVSKNADDVAKIGAKEAVDNADDIAKAISKDEPILKTEAKAKTNPDGSDPNINKQEPEVIDVGFEEVPSEPILEKEPPVVGEPIPELKTEPNIKSKGSEDIFGAEDFEMTGLDGKDQPIRFKNSDGTARIDFKRELGEDMLNNADQIYDESFNELIAGFNEIGDTKSIEAFEKFRGSAQRKDGTLGSVLDRQVALDEDLSRLIDLKGENVEQYAGIREKLRAQNRKLGIESTNTKITDAIDTEVLDVVANLSDHKGTQIAEVFQDGYRFKGSEYKRAKVTVK